MGYKFDYDDTFGQNKSMILQLEDIIEVVNSTTNVMLPSKDLNYQVFWKKYDGRKFRWVEYPEANNPTVSVTLETIVSEDSKDLLSEKTGVLLGQSGQIAKETYIKNSGEQKHNYYMRYVIQQKQVEDQKARIAALEQALIQTQLEKKALEDQLEELTKPETT